MGELVRRFWWEDWSEVLDGKIGQKFLEDWSDVFDGRIGQKSR